MNCANGNAKLAADGTPYLFWDDKWYPICGHYFWNDNHGVDAFCRELGFSSGTKRISNSNYGEDAIKIGSCKAGEDIASCTGEQNFYRVDSDCRPGTGNNAFTITCAGNPEGTEKNSCTGKIIAKVQLSSNHELNSTMIFNSVWNL